jgi:site-specific DNA recombinase
MNVATQNAVAAIRVSSTRQGTDGDSPEAQREQMDVFAKNKGITIKKFFVFLESASKEQQPMQEAITYSKDPKNEIDLFIIKSIDRFTRGGSTPYDQLKTQLEDSNVSLVDIYGVISTNRVNTLDHLGVEYKWSVYSPSKKSEILEAERGKDELRDIMSRMIGAEVRYTRMGYWMRQPPYGFKSRKVDTQNGKRTVLYPHPQESKYIVQAYELRASGRHSDKEIADMLNESGYKTRIRHTYNKGDMMKVVKQTGGKPMNERHLWRLFKMPIYAGINTEKWTNDEPVKCMFDGLVSVRLWNRANKGRKIIIELPNDRIIVQDAVPAKKLENLGVKSPQFPYKRFVMCPQCNKPLLGSSSRGKSGKYYPAYHCNKRGHNFRISKQDLEDTVKEYVRSIHIEPDRLDDLFKAVESSWEQVNAQYHAKVQAVDTRILELQNDASTTVGKLKVLHSETAIKYMEEDLMKIEKHIQSLEAQKQELETKKPVNFSKILARVKYFVEHLDELLIQQIDPVKKAQFFGVLFDKLPNYAEIKSRTPQNAVLHPLFEAIKKTQNNFESHLVIPTRIELVLPD